MLILKNIEQNENLIIYTVNENSDGKEIKQVLKSELNISSRLLTKLKKQEAVLLNGKYAKNHTIVKSGDVIQIIMVEPENQFEPQDIPLNIVYEDIDVIIINKQPGIVVHPTKSHPTNTIANALAYYLKEKEINCRIRFVNRLDMDTSGLLIIAKNAFTHHVISEQMQQDLVQKKYLTFVEGSLDYDEGTIDKPIYRPSDDAVKRVVDDRGQRSVTKYKVVERFKDASLLEIELLTGRTHQIRVHLEHLGHPLIGDKLYGNSGNEHLIDRQALHACYLKFYQPRFKNIVEISASLPEDMEKLRKTLKNI